MKSTVWSICVSRDSFHQALTCMCRAARHMDWHDSFIRVTWTIHICDMTLSQEWVVTFPWVMRVCVVQHATWSDMTLSYVRQDSFICVTWLFRMCKSWLLLWIVHVRVSYSTPRRVTWLLHTCDMTHAYVWHDSFTWMSRDFFLELRMWCVVQHATWIDMTPSYVWHYSCICVTWLLHISESCLLLWVTHVCASYSTPRRVTWLLHTCDKTHSYVFHDFFIYWVAWSHRMPYLHRSFSAKEPYN